MSAHKTLKLEHSWSHDYRRLVSLSHLTTGHDTDTPDTISCLLRHRGSLTLPRFLLSSTPFPSDVYSNVPSGEVSWYLLPKNVRGPHT